MKFRIFTPMKNVVPVILLVFVLIFSCKKKEEPVTPPATTVIGTTGTTGGTAGVATATFNNLCSNQKTYGVINGFTYSLTTAQNLAMFSNAVYNNFNIPVMGSYKNAGTISLNNTIFKNSSNYYADTTNSVMLNSFVWTCTGGTVTAFTYTNTNPYVTYSDYVYWPDTISKTEGLNLLFTGLQQAGEVQVLIGNSGNNSPVTYTALTAAGSISISPANLNSLLTNTTAVIQCNFFKNNLQNIGGGVTNFRNVTSFVKTVSVKN